MTVRSTPRRVRSFVALLALTLTFGLAGVFVASPAFAAPSAQATATPNPAHVSDVVNFDGSGSTNATLYAWAWGDGSSAQPSPTGFSATHAYTAAGVYTVTLTVYDAQGNTATDKVVVNVDDTAPVAASSITPNPAKVGQVVTFDGSPSSDAESADANLTFAWDLGFKAAPTDAANVKLSGISPTYTFSTARETDVTLTVTDPQGAKSTQVVHVVATNSAPVAKGTITPTSAAVTQEVTFDASTTTDAETPDNLTYTWNFGDGSPGSPSTSTAKIAKHTYSSASTYAVTLTVKDPQALTSTKNFSLVIGANTAPTAKANASQVYANVGQTISLNGDGTTDAETPETLTYAWAFGDNSSASGKAVSHSWSSPGDKTVTLTVADPANNPPVTSSSDTDTVVIHVGNNVPDAAFSLTPNSAKAGQTVGADASASTDKETPTDLLYSWNFGDGSGNSAYSTTKTTAHRFTTAGTYTVTLRVKDPKGGIGTTTRSLVVAANGSPTAVITSDAADLTKVQRTDTVHFSAATSTDPDSDTLTYAWTLPDGTHPTTSTATYLFTRKGDFDVSLTVTDPYGHTDTKTKHITVIATTQAAIAGPSTSQDDAPVTFDGTGSTDPDGDTLTYAWEFPGSATSDSATPSYTFTDPGTYDVRLTVTDPAGHTDSAMTSITITDGTPHAVDHAPATAPVGKSNAFDGSDSSDPDGDALTYAWTFGDGGTATGVAPSHAYTTAGTFSVVLTVNDGHGHTDSQTKAVTVTNEAPTASIAALPEVIDVVSTPTFDGSGSTDAESATSLTYAWTFGDTASGTGVKPTHHYAAPGVYTVTLTVTDPQGRTATQSTTAYVASFLACDTAPVTQTGTWHTASATGAADGTYCNSAKNSTAGDKLKLTAEGTAFGLSFGKGLKGGAAKVIIDGVNAGTVDCSGKGSTPKFGATQVFTGLASGSHSVVIKVVKGRAYVDDLYAFGATG